MTNTHYCSIHQAVFFKRGKMRGYAHPVKDENGEDTGEWCNEEDLKKVQNLPPQPSDKLLPEHQEIIDQAEKSVAFKPQLAREASIEQQVCIKEIGECWRMGKFKDTDPLVVGYQAWLIDRLNYEEAKGETTKAQITQETATTGQAKTDVEVVAESPKTIGEFLSHIKGMGIKAPRTWLAKEWEVPITEVLTLPKCLELYKAIQEKGGLK